MNNRRQRNFDVISYLHRKAKSLFVLRCFEEAADICKEALEVNENGERLLKDYTPFVVIAIQAYAEINQCKKAVEFAIRAFGDPQRFSPEVTELCICLLLKAAEYSRADELAERWLSCEENFLNHKYLKITELYVKHVLLPQGLHRRIDIFLEGNEALTLEQKQEMVISLKTLSEKLECHSQPVKTNSIEAPAQHIDAREKQVIGSRTVRARLFAVVRSFQRLLSLNLSYHHWKKSIIIVRILILAFFVYTLVFAAGVAHGSGISVLWQAVLAAWRALFHPYHLT